MKLIFRIKTFLNAFLKTPLFPVQPTFFSLLGLSLILVPIACIPTNGIGPTPRELRKEQLLKLKNENDSAVAIMYPESLFPKITLIDFPYRNINEIKLSWKVVAGLDLNSKELKELKTLILDNVKKYWQFRFPNQEISSMSLENLSVQNAQILLAKGYPLLLYSAYDINNRQKQFSFENYDICVGYTGLVNPSDKQVSFKLNSGLRGYIDANAMLTGTLLDVPRLKNSKVQVLQVRLFTPPGQDLNAIYDILREKYAELKVADFTLPVLEAAESTGSIR